MTGQRLHRNRLPLALVLACIFVMKALVPTGWMPVAANGLVELQLCSGMKAVPAQSLSQEQRDLMAALQHHAGTAGDDAPDGDQPMADQPCAFAAAAVVWPPLAETAPLFRAQAETALHGIPASAASVGRGLAAPPPPATGPPSRA